MNGTMRAGIRCSGLCMLLLRLRRKSESWSVRGPATGQATIIPIKLLSVKRPRAGAEKR